MPSVTDQATKDKIRREIEQITAAIEQLTGLRTQWNGEFDFAPVHARFKGLKPFACNILLREDLALMDLLWRTLIHEAFHAVSAGYNQSDFDQYVGLEEGVVEKLQRLFRPRILSQLNVTVDEELFQEEEARHPFNLYIAKLQNIQQVLGVMEEAFYLELIALPIKDRYRHLFNRAMQSKNAAAIAALSVARPVLESTNYASFTENTG